MICRNPIPYFIIQCLLTFELFIFLCVIIIVLCACFFLFFLFIPDLSLYFSLLIYFFPFLYHTLFLSLQLSQVCLYSARVCAELTELILQIQKWNSLLLLLHTALNQDAFYPPQSYMHRHRMHLSRYQHTYLFFLRRVWWLRQRIRSAVQRNEYRLYWDYRFLSLSHFRRTHCTLQLLLCHSLQSISHNTLSAVLHTLAQHSHTHKFIALCAAAFSVCVGLYITICIILILFLQILCVHLLVFVLVECLLSYAILLFTLTSTFAPSPVSLWSILIHIRQLTFSDYQLYKVSIIIHLTKHIPELHDLRVKRNNHFICSTLTIIQIWKQPR